MQTLQSSLLGCVVVLCALLSVCLCASPSDFESGYFPPASEVTFTRDFEQDNARSLKKTLDTSNVQVSQFLISLEGNTVITGYEAAQLEAGVLSLIDLVRQQLSGITSDNSNANYGMDSWVSEWQKSFMPFGGDVDQLALVGNPFVRVDMDAYTTVTGYDYLTTTPPFTAQFYYAITSNMDVLSGSSCGSDCVEVLTTIFEEHGTHVISQLVHGLFYASYTFYEGDYTHAQFAEMPGGHKCVQTQSCSDEYLLEHTEPLYVNTVPIYSMFADVDMHSSGSIEGITTEQQTAIVRNMKEVTASILTAHSFQNNEQWDPEDIVQVVSNQISAFTGQDDFPWGWIVAGIVIAAIAAGCVYLRHRANSVKPDADLTYAALDEDHDPTLV
jgi:hypothetical protein